MDCVGFQQFLDVPADEKMSEEQLEEAVDHLLSCIGCELKYEQSEREEGVRLVDIVQKLRDEGKL